MNQHVDTSDLNLDGVVGTRDSSAEPELAEVPTARPRTELSKMQRRRVWRVNYWLLAGTFVFIAVAGTALYFWRNYQVQRNAHVLIGRAELMEAEEDWRSAADFYHRYLQLIPSDSEVIVARAQAFDKSATTPDRASRAVTLLLQATDAAPDDIDLRLRLAERFVEQNRWDRARQQAGRILEARPDHLDAARIAALAYRNELGGGRSQPVSDAVQTHLDGLEQHPGDPVLSSSLATLYREHAGSFVDSSPEQMAQKADSVIDRMVADRPQDVEGYLGRYRYRETYGLDGAEEDLEQALELAPESSEVLRLAAMSLASSDPRRARELADRLVEIAPDDALSYLALADVQARSEQTDEAIATLQKGLNETGDDNYLLQRAVLGLALDSRRLETAEKARKKLGDWFRRVSPFLTAADRRRLDEDLQLAEARYLLLSGQPEAAVSDLKRLTVKFAEGLDADQNLRDREQRFRLLAEAYNALQQWDLAAQAMADAARLRPMGYQSLLGQASFARQSGDLDGAIQLAQEAAAKPSAPPQVWLALAELLIEAEFQEGLSQNRNWRRVRAALEQARPELEGTPAFVSLRARWALADGRTEDALEELQRILPVDAIPLETASELALLFSAAGDDAAADELVKRLEADPKHRQQGGTTRVDLLARRRNYDGARQLLDQLAKPGHDPQLEALLPRLVALELEGGYIQEARERLAQLRDAGPRTAALLDMGTALAFQSRDWDEFDRYVAALERQEGPKGTVARFYLALESLEHRGERTRYDLMRARELLRELEQLRPEWPAVLIVKGRLAERQQKYDEALVHYEDALRRGARGAMLIDWLVGGLYRQNRFADAVKIQRRLGPMAGMSPQLSGLALPAYLREGRVEDALQLARMTAEFHPKDPVSQVRYAQALTIAEDLEKAESVFRRAIELAPKDTRTWGGLVWFYARTGRANQAREVLAEVEGNQSIEKWERILLNARGLASIGDGLGAGLRYQEVLEARPNDLQVLEEAARFHLQGNLVRSLSLFRRILELSPESVSARRAIALIMGLSGSEEGLAEAIELIKDQDGSGSSLEDDRLEAILLMRGDAQQRAQALHKLESLVSGQEDVPVTDRILLAQAMELVERPEEALEQFELVIQQESGPEFLGIFLTFLLRQQKFELAEKWLVRLEDKDLKGPLPLRIRSELFAATDRNDEIPILVEGYVANRMAEDSPEPTATILREAIRVLTRYKFIEMAEKLLRRFVGEDAVVADMLVEHLLQRERLGEAAQVALESAVRFGEERPPNSLTHVLTMLVARELPISAIEAQAEQQFERALTHHADHVRFLFDLGTLRVMQGMDDEAIELYEMTLQLRPDYPLSLNNLAIMLAAIPERREEGQRMIEHLVALAPDSAEAKDSHALVLLASEMYQEAHQILEELVLAKPENARFLFHAAVVRDRLGLGDKARSALQSAFSLGLENEMLTPQERVYLDQLRRRYEEPSAE